MPRRSTQSFWSRRAAYRPTPTSLRLSHRLFSQSARARWSATATITTKSRHDDDQPPVSGRDWASCSRADFADSCEVEAHRKLRHPETTVADEPRDARQGRSTASREHHHPRPREARTWPEKEGVSAPIPVSPGPVARASGSGARVLARPAMPGRCSDPRRDAAAVRHRARRGEPLYGLKAEALKAIRIVPRRSPIAALPQASGRDSIKDSE